MSKKEQDASPPSPPECFVIMPIADSEGYPPGHWKRVYDHLIRPACEKAGFRATLASEVQQTHVIVLDILRRIVSAPIVICDLSSRNPNVLYELGVRQAFNLPVTLIKDTSTSRIFDVQGLRDVEYNAALRVDEVKVKIDEIALVLGNTAKATSEVNSMIELLKIAPAELPKSKTISSEAALILDRLDRLSARMAKLEDRDEDSLFGRLPARSLFGPSVVRRN